MPCGEQVVDAAAGADGVSATDSVASVARTQRNAARGVRKSAAFRARVRHPAHPHAYQGHKDGWPTNNTQAHDGWKVVGGQRFIASLDGCAVQPEPAQTQLTRRDLCCSEARHGRTPSTTYTAAACVSAAGSVLFCTCQRPNKAAACRRLVRGAAKWHSRERVRLELHHQR